MKQRLDTYDRIPPAMADYLSQYGWHFSKKMCLWAVSHMKMENKSTGKEEKLEPISKEQVEELLKKYSINLEKDAGYDSVTWQTWRSRITTKVLSLTKPISHCSLRIT